MQGFYSWANVGLVGDTLQRAVTIVLPTEQVRSLLPSGMELGPQDVTPRGTHPVMLGFAEMYGAQMTIPTLLPILTYFEHVVGVPFVELSGTLVNPLRGGPFLFMPQLFLTDYLATLGGRLWWGFAKDLAQVVATEGRFQVRALDGRPLVTLDYAPIGDYQPVDRYPHFAPIQAVLGQPLVSRLPLGLGPWLVRSWFEKNWLRARIRPLATVLHIEEEYVPGLPRGQYPVHGRNHGIDQGVLGSYEFTAPWRQSLVCPMWMG